MYKEIIKSHLLDYLKLRKYNYQKRGKITMMECPICQKGLTANIIPNTSKIHCFLCKQKYDLLDVALVVEKDFPEEEENQLQYLKKILKLKLITKKDNETIEEALDFYEKNNWALIALSKSSKVPIQGVSWKEKEYRNKNDWKNWLVNKSNIGVRTGEISGIIIVDIDVLTTVEKEELRSGKSKDRQELMLKRQEKLNVIYKKMAINPKQHLIQNTLGGQHIFFQYDREIPKTFIDIDDIHIDIEADGGYIVLFPSSVGNDYRKFDKLIQPQRFPDNIKKIIFKKSTKKTEKNIIPVENKVKLDLIQDGSRDVVLTQLGGIFRNHFTPAQTEQILHLLNNNCCSPSLDYRQIVKIAHSLKRYTKEDDNSLIQQVFDFLEVAKDGAFKGEIEMAVFNNKAKGEQKKKLEQALNYLIQDNKLIKAINKYQLVQKTNWKTKMISIVRPLEFKIPYLNDAANFHWGEMVLMGGESGTGKTRVVMNMVQRLVKQDIRPYLIETEPNKKFIEVGMCLGLKEGDFYYSDCDPNDIDLEPNAVTIIDWLMPKDFSKVDKLFYRYNRLLTKSNGFLIVFMQLREGTWDFNNSKWIKEPYWFAKDLVTHYPNFVSRYLINHTNRQDAELVIDKRNDPKYPYVRKIPFKYFRETEEVKRIDEIEEINE